ncbi:uncharacterized protein LOC133203128 [Saccostrea echinata]|uniref:uncharacterized protein LOC133203128 n=1 Tax=Saccostrea echinata TaxID=191078 RepID=UPI002A827412|nr:uncharacterized protein LOC133203128 [Saccostrea echinata]
MNKQSPTQLKPPECFQCKSNAEYYCRTCKQDLCVLCKEEHVIDFDTKLHDVVIDRLKYGDIIILETCKRHQNMISSMWCLVCQLPLCSYCAEHSGHYVQDIKLVYKKQHEQHQEIIFHVKSEIMLYAHSIQSGINSDFKPCQTEILKLQENMVIKAERLKDQIDVVLEDIKKLKRYLNSKQKQQRRHISSIQKRVHRSEQLATRAIQFLLFSKNNSFYKINNKTPSASIVQAHSLIKEINKDNVFNCLVGISITEPGKRQVRTEHLFKVMSPPVLKKTFRVKPTGVRQNVSRHISCVTPNVAWVSGWNNLNLTDTMGDNLHYLEDLCHNEGVHTVTREGNLVYIDRDYNIKKLSLNNEAKSTLMRKAKPWKPLCLYCSPLNGDLLIGMKRQDALTAKVGRYNIEGQELQHNPGQGLYNYPRYITENQNGDVIITNSVLSDLGVIVVTDFLGTHRFSYTGSPKGSKFDPIGICTDALSHILVCDAYTKTVQMIDKDGQFLTVLLTEEQGVEYPFSLSYDHRSHLLWVGSSQNIMICIYRHIQRHEHLTGNH